MRCNGGYANRRAWCWGLCWGLLAVPAAADEPPAWEKLRPVPLQGDLRAFWNVGGNDREYNGEQAAAHGFRPVTLLNTYADYPGRQKEKRPLVRKLQVADDEWIVLAVDPWQNDAAQRTINVDCGRRPVEIELRGRHTQIVHVRAGKVQEAK